MASKRSDRNETRWTRLMRANLPWSLPLLLFGLGSLVAGLLLYFTTAHGPAQRFPPWGLAVAIGLLALLGGAVSLLLGDFSSEAERGLVQLSAEEMVVPKGEWLELRKRVEQLSLRSRDEPSPAADWADASSAPESLAFMPVGTPSAKSSGRRHGRGGVFGRAPSGGRPPEEFEPRERLEPPAPPPPVPGETPPAPDWLEGPAESPPKGTKPKPSADSS